MATKEHCTAIVATKLMHVVPCFQVSFAGEVTKPYNSDG